MPRATASATRCPSIAALLPGGESHGISPEVRAVGGESDAYRTIAVPRVGGAESLNVAMAAAALCMEFTRQGMGR